jgi:hypothetical protein
MEVKQIVGSIGEFLERNKEVLDAWESIFTITGIIVAGVWAYWHFVRRRERFPGARFEQKVQTWEMNDNYRVIRVTLMIHNHSNVLLCVGRGSVWLQQIKPWPETLIEKLKNKESPVVQGETEIQWPIIAERDFEFSGQKELEPNESDEIIVDFVMDKECEELLVYSHVENAAKPGTNLGWSVSTTFSLIDEARPQIIESMDRQGSVPDKRQGQAKPRPEQVEKPKTYIQSQPKPRPEKPEKKTIA